MNFIKINIILIFVLLIICFFVVPRPLLAADDMALSAAHDNLIKPEVVMIIPLDSRPANTIYPALICKAAGFVPLLPPAEYMDNFKTPARAKAIANWMTANAEKADAYIISVTMLCYGGLVASRTSNERLREALDNLKYLQELKTRFPDKPVFVYDIIQRLAVTASSEKELEYYNLIRQWAILEDKALEAPEEGDAAMRDRLRQSIPQNVFDDYMKARKRNNAVNIKTIQMCSAGFIDYLIIGQDDASKYGIHKKEARALEKLASNLKLNGRFNIFSGADEIDAVLTARLASYFYGAAPSYYAVYPDTETPYWIAPFEDIKISENIKRHIEAAGSKMCGDISRADVILAVNAPADTEDKRIAGMKYIVNSISDLIDKGRFVSAADLTYANRSDTSFVELLIERADIRRLASYSAWNTAGNKLGFAIAQASARWHALNTAPEKIRLSCAKAHYEFLILRFIKDYCYKNFIIKSAEEYINKINADKFDLKNSKNEVEAFIANELSVSLRKWANRFMGFKAGVFYNKDKSAIKFINEVKPFYITGIKNIKITLPWPRIFECAIEFELVIKSIDEI